MFNQKRNLIAALFALGMASCSILPPKQTPNTYLLPQTAAAAAQTSANAQPLAWQLRVDTPEASGMIDSTGILVSPQPDRITVYANALWSDNAPVLLRERMVNAFLATQQLPAVISEGDSLHADIVLSGDLRAFQSEYRNGSPVVVVRFYAQLRRGGSPNVFAARSFEATRNPSGVAVPQVVQAFGAACDQLSAQVVAWTLAQGQQAWQKRSTPKAKAQ